MAKLGSVIIQIRHQIDAIGRWLSGKSIDDFKNDMLLRNAIERSIEIIYEATRRIPVSEKSRFPDVPWQDIADIGNYLRHQYHDLNENVLWNVVQGGHLEQLSSALEVMNPNLDAVSRAVTDNS